MSKEYLVNDDEFLVSKTDTKGVITYCNEPFINIVGTSQKELLGKPHNIIRHEDMPKVVFWLLWQRVKNKQEIFAYVKNKRFDGGFYWVFANVTASLDENGNIIGYYSVRRRPNKDAINFIEPIYQMLLNAENSGGLEASKRLLEQILKDNNIGYDELIINLQRGTKLA